jgi:tetratricopeptide (TPR) repeat protein
VVMYRELAAASPDRYRPALADSLSNVGVRFSALGRSAEALRVTEEAVVMYRELAAAYPDRYGSELARSLRALSQALEKLGRTAEADATRREANDQPQSGQPGSV